MRRQVVEIVCDRCKRKENQLPVEQPVPALELKYKGRVIKFDDLCASCVAAVEGYVGRIAKDTPTPKDELAKDPPKEEPVKKGLFSR